MNWIQAHWSAVQLGWVHELSQSALALAVAVLGIVILLELASIARLRRTVDVQMQRMFEQLDLLRGDNLQLLEAQRPAAPARPSARQPETAAVVPGTAVAQYSAPPVTPAPAPAAATAPALGAGEARLLAALSAARARLGQGAGRGVSA